MNFHRYRLALLFAVCVCCAIVWSGCAQWTRRRRLFLRLFRPLFLVVPTTFYSSRPKRLCFAEDVVFVIGSLVRPCVIVVLALSLPSMLAGVPQSQWIVLNSCKGRISIRRWCILVDRPMTCFIKHLSILWRRNSIFIEKNCVDAGWWLNLVN